jgi:hypothetical protein
VKGRREMKDVDAICNRHIARLLTDLEEANCPAIFRDAVKSKLQWLRQDLNEMNEGARHELVSKVSG